MPLPLPRSVAEVAKRIDHTLLKPAATRDEVVRVAEEGVEFGAAAVCVNPVWAAEVHRVVEHSGVLCCCVVGFPLGASHREIIADEAARAAGEGARELDMVLNLGRARAGEWNEVAAGVAAVKAAIGDGNLLKVILEICELDNGQIEKASQVAVDAGADFIKTSTGFGKSGATVEAVRIMARVAGGRAGIKAAGGIRTWADMQAMLRAGATRIGASSTAAILAEARAALE